MCLHILGVKEYGNNSGKGQTEALKQFGTVLYSLIILFGETFTSSSNHSFFQAIYFIPPELVAYRIFPVLLF